MSYRIRVTALLFLSVLNAAHVLAQLAPGNYTIKSDANPYPLRVYHSNQPDQPILAAPGGGPPQVWDVTSASGGVYTIKSTYGNGFFSAEKPHEDDLVNTKSESTPFQIKQVGGGKHVVKVPNKNLVFDVGEPPAKGTPPQTPVVLKHSTGKPSQKFTFEKVLV